MPIKSILLFILILSLTSNNAEAQQAAIYKDFPDNQFTLYIPGIQFGDNRFGNAWLDLENDNRFVVDRFTTLDKEETAILDLLENTACSPAGNIEKVAAYLSYLDGTSKYCLQLEKGTTIEGGSIFYYLFIEEGTFKYIADVRLDGFAQCCFQNPGPMEELMLGTIENGDFSEITVQNEIQLDVEYTLRFSDPDGYVYEF